MHLCVRPPIRYSMISVASMFTRYENTKIKPFRYYMYHVVADLASAIRDFVRILIIETFSKDFDIIV